MERPLMTGLGISRHYVLAAGGTGGHMIPAHALAEELRLRGHHVALITDERGARIPGLFENVPVHVLPVGRIAGGPIGWMKALKNIFAGRAMASRMYETFRPSAVIGFGGYPALPALLAARKDGIPTLVHEQNAVLGRVNRLMASRVDAIATSYPEIHRLPPKQKDKVKLVGNPVRDEILALREQPYPALSEDGIFRVLVIGGSQGATVLSEVVPDGLAMLPEHFRRRLQVTQQCRPEDIEQVRAKYASHGIPADLATYFADVPQRLAWSHLVIARAGASSIAELTAAGRPAILIPLPTATDNHQVYNTREMVKAGGARMVLQTKFNAVELAKQMQKLGIEPAALGNAAERAKSVGRPDATKDLADLVERIGRDPAADALGADERVLRPIPQGAYA
jgi:UDP-N-acetylglucosamine--N-acetylmuramyl-(pentapeptide) pyrophosphoryl-undecaprenol N-acetylglucosamine transferase